MAKKLAAAEQRAAASILSAHHHLTGGIPSHGLPMVGPWHPPAGMMALPGAGLHPLAPPNANALAAAMMLGSVPAAGMIGGMQPPPGGYDLATQIGFVAGAALGAAAATHQQQPQAQNQNQPSQPPNGGPSGDVAQQMIASFLAMQQLQGLQPNNSVANSTAFALQQQSQQQQTASRAASPEPSDPHEKEAFQTQNLHQPDAGGTI